jgi:hypothetical protein
MSEENIPQVINNIITPPTPSNVPLYIFLICFGIWAYTISLNEKSWSPKWDDLIVSVIILIPLFFIAKCTISGNCGLILISASAIVLVYSIYSAYKNFKTDDEPDAATATATETPTAATST